MAHGGGSKVSHARSSERRFEKYIIQVDSRPIGVRRLICAEPGCGQEGEIFDRTHDGLPSQMIRRKFHEKGWEVGDSPKHDFCPACNDRRRTERRTRKFKPVVVSNQPEPVDTKGERAMPAEAVVSDIQAMSRSDRRIIFAKLEEVYLDEDRGYQSPWTDAAVAKDLGSHIPVGWVAQVREENFGPAKDNGEIRDMLVRVAAAATEAKAILDETKALRREMAGHVEKMNELSRAAGDVGKKLDGLLILSDRIQRSLL